MRSGSLGSCKHDELWTKYAVHHVAATCGTLGTILSFGPRLSLARNVFEEPLVSTLTLNLPVEIFPCPTLRSNLRVLSPHLHSKTCLRSVARSLACVFVRVAHFKASAAKLPHGAPRIKDPDALVAQHVQPLRVNKEQQTIHVETDSSPCEVYVLTPRSLSVDDLATLRSWTVAGGLHYSFAGLNLALDCRPEELLQALLKRLLDARMGSRQTSLPHADRAAE